MYKKLITSLLLLVTTVVLAQVGSVTISVFDEFSKKPLSATVSIQGGKDEIFIGNGSVLIPEIPSGNYNFRISAEGYDDGFLNDINVVPNQNLTFSIGLNKVATQIKEVTITKKFIKPQQNPQFPLEILQAKKCKKMQVLTVMFLKQF
ncbi:MAG: carboxypeptidase-like regulatory domain-containing protein [Cloacibacterium normanense]